MTSEKNTTAAAPTTRTTTTGTSAEELPEAAATGSSSGPIFAGGGLLFQRLSVSAVPAASTPLLPAPTSSSTSSPSTPSSTETETKLSDRWVLSRNNFSSPTTKSCSRKFEGYARSQDREQLALTDFHEIKIARRQHAGRAEEKMVDFVVAKTGVDAEELGLLWKEQTRGKKNEGNELLASSSCTSFAMKSSGLVSYQQQKQHLQSESRRLSTSSATTPNVLCATRCKELSARRLTKLLSKAYTEAKPKIAEDRKVEFAVYINSLVKVLHRFYEEKVLNVAEMGGGGGK